MRKHHAPLGWPRRDPRHYRFAVPNVVWEYKLRPVEFVLLSYLCYRQTHGRKENTDNVQAVANSLHLTVATVEKHLSALISKGLITEDGALTLKCEAGKFFTLPNEIFLLQLPSSAFLVYAYLLLLEDRRVHTCHPSYNTIAAATGLSKNTVLKSVGVLVEKALITVKSSSYFDQHGMKWKGNNLYGYLKKPAKKLVDEIVDELAALPQVAECYEVWNRLRDDVESYYKDTPREWQPLSQQKEFKTIKNMVVREAETIRLGAVTFEDEDMVDETWEEEEDAPPNFIL